MSYGMMCVCVRVHGYMVIVCYWHSDPVGTLTEYECKYHVGIELHICT